MLLVGPEVPSRSALMEKREVEVSRSGILRGFKAAALCGAGVGTRPKPGHPEATLACLSPGSLLLRPTPAQPQPQPTQPTALGHGRGFNAIPSPLCQDMNAAHQPLL